MTRRLWGVLMMKHALAVSLLTSLTFGGFASGAFAQDAEAPQAVKESCLPLKPMKETMGKFDSLKPERVDTVRAAMQLTVKGDLLPRGIEARDGETRTPLTIDQETHSVQLAPVLASLSDDAELCILHPDIAEETLKEAGYGIGIQMGVRFHETPGTHTLAQIEDGLKDGRAHYRKLVGATGFLVPKFDHLAVAGHDPENPPRLWAVKDGEDVAQPDGILLNGARLISLDELEETGADSVRIDGYYRLSPSPDADAVRKYMSE